MFLLKRLRDRKETQLTSNLSVVVDAERHSNRSATYRSHPASTDEFHDHLRRTRPRGLDFSPPCFLQCPCNGWAAISMNSPHLHVDHTTEVKKCLDRCTTTKRQHDNRQLTDRCKYIKAAGKKACGLIRFQIAQL